MLNFSLNEVNVYAAIFYRFGSVLNLWCKNNEIEAVSSNEMV